MPQALADDLLSLPPPQLAPAALLALVQAQWGLTGQLTPLTAERDLNHRLDTGAGRYVVKLANAAEPEAMTAFQSGALQHAAAVDPGLPIPHLLPTRAGAPWLTLPQGRLRLLTWLDGQPAALAPRSPAQARASGAVAGRLARALAGYDPAGADPVILWDIQRLPRLAALLPELGDAGLRDAARAFIADFETRVAPRLARLPRQVCHNDFNPHNLLTDPEDPSRIAGVIDFGDMVVTPRICDLAVACAYQVDPADPVAGPRALVAGYATAQTLLPEELALLPDLIAARMLTSLVISTWRAARYPQNAAYILRNAPNATAGLAALKALPAGAMVEALEKAAQPKVPQ
ncbi:phosphotransferase [Xinfangfangia pollutisoli]|uniref:phosphotransferase n=1 Tax=Xinfangfangia pollutisoli TaxID=2865960 RepID=UPI001CD67557|nr:phosphotransferase [Xinfangfangia pollutisoli]